LIRQPPDSARIRQPAWLLWSTLPAILLVLAFGLWLRTSIVGPTTIDVAWLNLVGLDLESVPYWVAVTLAEVGGGLGAIICTGILAAIFAARRRFRSAGYLVTTMLLGIALSESLKAVVTRVRPEHQLYESLGYSYPSGHSMGAAALAMGLAIIATRSQMIRAGSMDPTAVPQHLRFHWSMLLAAVWILTMMWSRTALQVHWLSDTFAGALIGISAAVLADEVWTLATTKARSPLPEG
jgi:membrane-associated phospholipid phosphatase